MSSKADCVAFCTGKWSDDELQNLAEDEHTTRELFLFMYCFQELCAKPKSTHGAKSKTLRISAWQLLDFNGNKIVSLAETGKFVGERLITFYNDGDQKGLGVSTEECKLLYKRFYPCFIRAFLDAADFGAPTKVTQKGGGKVYGNTKTTGDDYVQFREFRLLCTYLCIYAAIYEAFGNVDGGGKGIDATDDRRISKDEWTKNGTLLKGHPLLSLSISANGDPGMIFDAMDGDGKGKVLLAEFSTYIEDYEFALKTRWGKLLNAGEAVANSAGDAVAAAAGAT
jgi:hypothetical protein